MKGTRSLDNSEILLVSEQFTGTYATRNRSLFMLGVSVGGRFLLLLVCIFGLFSCGTEEEKDEAAQKVNGYIIEPKAKLQGKDFSNANLQNAKLQEANLQRAILNFALLDQANLQGADLSFAFLRGASLVDANLAFANLRFADLQGANLRNAQLQRTDLRSANLLETTLDRTNFQGAVFNGNTKFPKGFDSTQHDMIFDDLPVDDQGNEVPGHTLLNRVLSLDGDGDYVQNRSPVNLPLGKTDRTMELWINIRNWFVTRMALVQYGQKAGFGEMCGLLFIDAYPKKLYFWGHVEDLPGNTILKEKTWIHLAMTYDGSLMTLYVNGQVDAIGKPQLNTILNADGLFIGHRPTEAVLYFNGFIDEVRLWDTARTQDQIQATMNTILTGREQGLVGYWNFDDGTANDRSPNGNDGVLKGDAKIIESDFRLLGRR